MKIKKATINEKLIINKNDIEDPSEFESLYLYNYGDEFFSSLEELDDFYLVPSNSIFKLQIEDLKDERTKKDIEPILEFNGKLRPEQLEAIRPFFPNGIGMRGLRSGLLQAPCGWGKTFAACSLIAEASLTTLVIVHTKLLFYQWIDELKKLIPNQEIGMIGDGKFNVKPITVAIYKSANNNLEAIRNEFSLVIVDEAHLCHAETFSETVNNLNSRYKIAITATPARKDGHHLVLPDYFGDKLVVAKDSRKLADCHFEIVKTEIPFMIFNINRDWTAKLSELGENTKYLTLIAEKAKEKINEGRCLLILSERVSMLKELLKLIPDSKLLIGETPQTERDKILGAAGKEVKAILTTKIFDEGISCHRLDTIFLTCPNNNPIKLEQRVGRIIRLHPDKKDPLIVDFWLRGHIVQAQQSKRIQWYLVKGFKPIEPI